MRIRRNFLVILIIFITILICCEKRTQSTTGSLFLSNNFYHDSLTWNVKLLPPFDIGSSPFTISKLNNLRSYLVSPDWKKQSVLQSFQGKDMSFNINFIEPGLYHVIIYSAIAYNNTTKDVYVYNGETLYAEYIPDFINRYSYKPIFISNVRISADSISFIPLDNLFEMQRYLTDNMETDYREIVYSEWQNNIRQKE